MKALVALVALIFTSWMVGAQEMVEVKAGSFTMGNASFSREIPIRTVNIGRFYLSKTDIINEQFAAFMNAYGSDTVKEGPNIGKRLCKEDSWGVVRENGVWKAALGFENFPVVQVTWYGADAYCKAAGGRLPTEAEWEYAAKGGPSQQTFTFSGSSTATNVAWFYDNSTHVNHAVSLKAANTLGLTDMSGNVYQWCSDWFGRYGDFGVSGESNPQGPTAGASKVIRGGYRSSGSGDLHLTNRESLSPDECFNFVGFRLAMDKLPASVHGVESDVLWVYPNPSNDFIQLKAKESLLSVALVGLNGQALFSTEHPTGYIDVRNIPNGLYLLRLKTTAGPLVRKVVIKHP